MQLQEKEGKILAVAVLDIFLNGVWECMVLGRIKRNGKSFSERIILYISPDICMFELSVQDVVVLVLSFRRGDKSCCCMSVIVSQSG